MTGYRYEITDVRGESPVEVGAVIVENRFMGLWHTWTVVDIPTGTTTATFSGRYLGRRTV